MKKNQIKILALGLVILIALVGCTPATNNNDTSRNNRLSTQTRIGENNGWTRDNMDTELNNGLGNGNGLNNDRNMGMNDGFGDNANNGDPNNTMNDNTNNGLNNGMTRPNNNNNDNNNMSQNAGEIERKITALPEVNSAKVVLTNDTALVGCNLRGATQGTMTNALRQKIERIVKDNSNIDEVSVTSNPDLYRRIQTMSSGIGSGRTTDSFTNDIRDIIRNITNDINNIGR